MDKIQRYCWVVAVGLMCFSSILQAQTQYGNEFVLSLGAGGSAFKYQLDEGQSKSGFGWELGLAYSHYFNRTMGFSIGLEVERFAASVDIDQMSYKQEIKAPPELLGRFELYFDYSGLEEKQSAVMLQIPVLLQLQFPVSEKGFFYLGTGIKAGFPVSLKWNQNIGQLTTRGYSEYTGQYYENMPNHGFSTSYSLSTSGQLDLKGSILFALEGGLKFTVSEGTSFYTGVFLDWGLNDMYKASGNPAPLEYNTASPANYLYKSILATDRYSVADGIKPFALGVKIKMGFGMGGKIANKPEKPNEPNKKDKPERKRISPKEQKIVPVGD